MKIDEVLSKHLVGGMASASKNGFDVEITLWGRKSVIFKRLRITKRGKDDDGFGDFLDGVLSKIAQLAHDKEPIRADLDPEALKKARDDENGVHP